MKNFFLKKDPIQNEVIYIDQSERGLVHVTAAARKQ